VVEIGQRAHVSLVASSNRQEADLGGREDALHQKQGNSSVPLASNSVAGWILAPLGPSSSPHLGQQRTRLKLTPADLSESGGCDS